MIHTTVTCDASQCDGKDPSVYSSGEEVYISEDFSIYAPFDICRTCLKRILRDWLKGKP